ncbi:glycine zipper domain-containing protein [Roseomonas sp. KE0001]|uniref:glycine zipper domain-containing protein n=1 Tax=Roseomonas sp. KE0001 TaxID=2479201 RepID=UPI0018DF01AA|nr:hypothetical protein [Roseomonas sp. KE0001]MBI0434899.1 hypothetical protein [Roseomonas sp. KE0001]
MARSSSSSFDTSSVEERIADLRRKVEDLMEEQITPAVSRAAGKAQHLAQRAKSTARHEADHAVDFMRERPLATVAVAVGVGFLIAQLLRR